MQWDRGTVQNQIVWLDVDTSVQVQVDEQDRVRLTFGPEPHGVVMIGDRYQLHCLIIEVDRQLSRWARPGLGH